MIRHRTSSHSSTKSRVLFLASLVVAGATANYYQVSVLPGIDVGLCSFFALLATQVMGIGGGVVTGAMIAGFSWPSLHPASVAIVVLEITVVGFLAVRRRSGLVTSDILFWIFLGIPLFFMLYLQESQGEAASLIMAGRQGANAIANAVLARCAMSAKALRHNRSLPLRDITFNTLAFSILCPAIAFMAVTSRTAQQSLYPGWGGTLGLFLATTVGSAVAAEMMSSRFVRVLELFDSVSEPLSPNVTSIHRGGGATYRIEEASKLLQNYQSTTGSLRALYTQINRLTETLEERIVERTRDLAKHEAFTLNIMDSLRSSIAVLDGHGKILVVNQPWRDFARDNGVPGIAAAFLGENYLEVCQRGARLQDGSHAADALAGIEAVLSGREDQFVLEYPCHAPEELRWFVLVVSKLTGPCIGAVVSHTDITRRKLAEEALYDSELKHRLFFDHAGDAIIVSEAGGRVLEVNQQACELLSYSSEQLQSMSYQQLHPPQHQQHWPELMRQIAQHGQLLYETQHIRSDGTNVPIEVSSRMVNWNGRPALLSICRNLTERKQFEEEIHKALEAAHNANSSMKRLLQTVSHEFRTPLGLLTCSVDILDRYWERLLPGDRVQHHDTIRNAAQQLAVLVSSVTAFNQTQTSSGQGARWVDIGDISRRIASDVETVWGEAHTFEVEIAACGEALLDETLFRRILENLLTNAFRFTPTGGVVKLKVTNEGGLLLVEVADNGIGIPEEDQGRIFDAFYRSHNVEARRGLGLGLSIVREALLEMGGAIKVQSCARAGCTMTVEIPLQ